METFEPRTDLAPIHLAIGQIKESYKKIIVGQEELVDFMLVSILTGGHILIEGMPGIAKTLSAKLLAKSIDSKFSRIQFTPDLMPSDIIGTPIFNIKNSEFQFKKGPLFANIVLIDEINRAPAKTQAALFEAMEEQQISVDGITYLLDSPFLLLATQNPIEQEGTYRLPEAQLDRFLFKIKLSYPKQEEEFEIIRRFHQDQGLDLQTVSASLSSKEIINLQQLIKSVHLDEKLLVYISKIVSQTRTNPFLLIGASPRASLALVKASKALAVINGRDFVTPEDIQYLLNPVLNHRLTLFPEREMEGLTTEDVIKQIMSKIEIPR